MHYGYRLAHRSGPLPFALFETGRTEPLLMDSHFACPERPCCTKPWWYALDDHLGGDVLTPYLAPHCATRSGVKHVGYLSTLHRDDGGTWETDAAIQTGMAAYVIHERIDGRRGE